MPGSRATALRPGSDPTTPSTGGIACAEPEPPAAPVATVRSRGRLRRGSRSIAIATRDANPACAASSEVCSGNRTHFTQSPTGSSSRDTWLLAARRSRAPRERHEDEQGRRRRRRAHEVDGEPPRPDDVRDCEDRSAARPPRASSTTRRGGELSPASARTFCRSSIAQYASSATRSSPAARTGARVQGGVVEREVDGTPPSSTRHTVTSELHPRTIAATSATIPSAARRTPTTSASSPPSTSASTVTPAAHATEPAPAAGRVQTWRAASTSSPPRVQRRARRPRPSGRPRCRAARASRAAPRGRGARAGRRATSLSRPRVDERHQGRPRPPRGRIPWRAGRRSSRRSARREAA